MSDSTSSGRNMDVTYVEAERLNAREGSLRIACTRPAIIKQAIEVAPLLFEVRGTSEDDQKAMMDDILAFGEAYKIKYAPIKGKNPHSIPTENPEFAAVIEVHQDLTMMVKRMFGILFKGEHPNGELNLVLQMLMGRNDPASVTFPTQLAAPLCKTYNAVQQADAILTVYSTHLAQKFLSDGVVDARFGISMLGLLPPLVQSRGLSELQTEELHREITSYIQKHKALDDEIAEYGRDPSVLRKMPIRIVVKALLKQNELANNLLVTLFPTKETTLEADLEQLRELVQNDRGQEAIGECISTILKINEDLVRVLPNAKQTENYVMMFTQNA